MNSKFLIYILLLGVSNCLFSQSLLDKLENEHKEIENYTMSTFKGTRLSISHSVETRKKNTLEVSLMTRYWNREDSDGKALIPDLFCSRIGLDYGISDRLTVGIGYGNPNRIIDNYFKYRLIRQTDDNKTPLSLTLLQTASYRTHRLNDVVARGADFGQKFAFTTQALIARKFTRNFSLQITPTYVQRTSSRSDLDDDHHFAFGFGARQKISNHLSLVSEYYYVINPLNSVKTFSPFAFGVNWEVSKLLLQFKMTNNQIFSEDTFITQTFKPFNFSDGNFFFGFQATYHFQL